MAVRKVHIELDEALVRRARDQAEALDRSDSDVIAEAVTAFLGLSALHDAHAQSTPPEHDVNRLAIDEVRGYRASRGHAA